MDNAGKAMIVDSCALNWRKNIDSSGKFRGSLTKHSKHVQ